MNQGTGPPTPFRERRPSDDCGALRSRLDVPDDQSGGLAQSPLGGWKRSVRRTEHPPRFHCPGRKRCCLHRSPRTARNGEAGLALATSHATAFRQRSLRVPDLRQRPVHPRHESDNPVPKGMTGPPARMVVFQCPRELIAEHLEPATLLLGFQWLTGRQCPMHDAGRLRNLHDAGTGPLLTRLSASALTYGLSPFSSGSEDRAE